eukprot:6510327-Pyramimonas_sp.AAC.1
MKVKKRGNTETVRRAPEYRALGFRPCHIKEFIDKVISSPEDEVSNNLRSFTSWEYGKVRCLSSWPAVLQLFPETF